MLERGQHSGWIHLTRKGVPPLEHVMTMMRKGARTRAEAKAETGAKSRGSRQRMVEGASWVLTRSRDNDY